MFIVSTEYVSDMIRLPDEITPDPSTEDYITGMTTSHGRVVTIIDLVKLLGLNTGNGGEGAVTDAGAQPQSLMILKGTPVRGILVDRLLSVEPAENFEKSEKNFFRRNSVKGVYIHSRTNKIVMEIDIEHMLSRVPVPDGPE